MKKLSLAVRWILFILGINFLTHCSKNPEPVPAPAAPSALSVSVISSTQINISWTDNSSNEDGFKVERAIVGGAGFSEIATVGTGLTAFQSTGLTPNTTYSYRVRAFNASGQSAYSNTGTGVTPDIIPLAPSALTATAVSSVQVNLAWADNSANEQGFKIERAPGGTASFTEIASVPAATTSYQNTGLTASTGYSYRVRAFGSAGNSEYSNIATVTTPAAGALPAAPSGLTATAVSSTQINLAWTDNSSNEQGFKIERAPGGTTTFAEIASVGVGVVTYQSTGLTASTGYNYRVRAFNASGNSNYSNTATATTQAAGTLPGAPSGLTATAASSSQINLAWTDNSNNELGFKIERAPGGTSTFAEIATVGAGVVAYQNTGLTAGTGYNYRVYAYNASGNSSYSNTATATTQTAATPPAAPTNLVATPVSTTQINLSWTDNSSNEQGFKIERAPGGTTTFAEIATVGVGITTYQNTGLVASTSYAYRVRAYNTAGNSGYSNTDTKSTLTPAQVPGISAPTTSTGSFNVTLTYNWPTIVSTTDKYELEQSTTSSTTGFSVTHTSPSNTHTSPYVIPLTRTSGTYYYRARVYSNSTWTGYSNVVQVTVTVSNGTLRIVNNTRYDLIDIQLNGVQKVGTNQGVLVGNSIDFTFTSSGTVNYALGVGFWESGVRNVWFTSSGTTTVTIGQVTTITFSNPTIAQLLSGFSSYDDWVGYYFQGTSGPFYAKFRFNSTGTWQLYDNTSMTGTGGTQVGSGSVTLTSWPNYATIVQFKLCTTCDVINLAYPFGQFMYNNGPAGWVTIQYTRQ